MGAVTVMASTEFSDIVGRIRRYDLFIGGRLREARLNRRWTQDKLAQALGVSFQSVQRYERGASVGAGRLIVAANALDVSILSLMRDSVDAGGAPLKDGAARDDVRAALSQEAAETARLLDGLAEPELRRCVLEIVRRLAA